MTTGSGCRYRCRKYKDKRTARWTTVTREEARRDRGERKARAATVSFVAFFWSGFARVTRPFIELWDRVGARAAAGPGGATAVCHSRSLLSAVCRFRCRRSGTRAWVPVLVLSANESARAGWRVGGVETPARLVGPRPTEEPFGTLNACLSSERVWKRKSFKLAEHAEKREAVVAIYL